MLTISIDTKGKEPMYEQIYKHIREEIKNGNIPCGTKLPSGRGMAAHLEVSRNTIDMAYGQLLSEGYIESVPKKGYYVCALETLYMEGIKVKSEARDNDSIEKQQRAGETADGKKAGIPDTFYEVDFSPRGVDMDYFPYGKWRKLMKECLIDDNKELFLSGNHQGDEQLRKAVQDYLYQSRGVKCRLSQIIIGAGSDYMLLLLSRIFNRQVPVAMENPAYKQAYTIFKSVGYPITPIEMDEQGIRVDVLEQTDAQLISAVNSAFGTSLAPEDFTQVMQAIRAVYIDTSHYTDPSTKNNLDLVQWAIAAEKAGWGYVWGTFGEVLTESYYEAKAAQYPDEVGGYEDFIRQNWLGGRTADCVGFIKGYGWLNSDTHEIEYGTNGMPDIGANQMYYNARESGPISTMPDIPGLAVWHDGHIGVYIGGGQVVEAMGTKYGVVKTELAGRGWTHWLKVPYINYD